MKAILLAAGLGTRLRPITNFIPKCLVPICGKPLLHWWIKLLEQHGITEILINLHYLPRKVIEFFYYVKTNIKIDYFLEENLLGTAQTIKANKEYFKNEEDFFILYADNLTNYNLTEFKKFHDSQKNPLSVALFKPENLTGCGIIKLDNNNNIIDFKEKPKIPESTLANAGIFLAKTEIIDLIDTEINFTADLLPKLIGKMSGWESNDFLIDIGTPENLNIAEKKWNSMIMQ